MESLPLESENINSNFPLLPIIGIFAVSFLSLIGSMTPPLLAQYIPNYNITNKIYYLFLNGFAAGVVLAVGYIHALFYSFISFSKILVKNSIINQYSWTGLIGMIGSLFTFTSEEIIVRILQKKFFNSSTLFHENFLNNNDNESINEKNYLLTKKEQIISKQILYYTEFFVLLFGLSFHSIFVGIALGVENNDLSLFIAVVAHQLFEGFALGSRLLHVHFQKKSTIWILDLFFILSAPIGIIIGIFIKEKIENHSFIFHIISGILEGLSGGILIYVSLVHMMKEEIEREEIQKFPSLLITLFIGFIFGSTTLSILAIWT